MKLKDILNDEMLGNFGLKKKSAVGPSLAAFGAGVLIGVGAKYFYGQMNNTQKRLGTKSSQSGSANS